MTNFARVEKLPLDTIEGIGRTAAEDRRSVIELARELIRTPSRGGIDPYEPIIRLLERWLDDRQLPSRRLHDKAGELVGLMVEIDGAQRHRRYVLDACVDTAPFGDSGAWRYPPTSAKIADGWLYGRGSADCKFGVATFAHIASRLRDHGDQLQSGVTVLFDADEHTGRFGGVRAFLEEVPADQVQGVMVGYPGLDKVVVGGRGFLRAKMLVHGVASHSGASDPAMGNAISKAADIVKRLEAAPLAAADGQDEDAATLRPRLTVTAIHAGDTAGSYTIVPDLCSVHVDVRLTASFCREDAVATLKQAAVTVDEQWPRTRPTEVAVEDSWPAYQLPLDSPLSTSLAQAAERWTGVRPGLKLAGPSNIGNYLASYDIPTTAGFGVRYRNLHGTDEAVDVDTGLPVQAAYHEAVLALAKRV